MFNDALRKNPRKLRLNHANKASRRPVGAIAAYIYLLYLGKQNKNDSLNGKAVTAGSLKVETRSSIKETKIKRNLSLRIEF